jgi:hypothetical protein
MLLALVKHYRPDVAGELGVLNLEVDTEGKSLDVWHRDGHGERRCTKIRLEPPLKDWRDVRERVLMMRDEAFKDLGVVSTRTGCRPEGPDPRMMADASLTVVLHLAATTSSHRDFLPTSSISSGCATAQHDGSPSFHSTCSTRCVFGRLDQVAGSALRGASFPHGDGMASGRRGELSDASQR